MNVLIDRISLPKLLKAAAKRGVSAPFNKHKQRVTALFFVALLIFQGVAAFEPLLLSADSKNPDPLKQVEKQAGLPEKLAKNTQVAAMTDPKQVGNNAAVPRKIDRTVVSEGPLDEYNNITKYADGSAKIHSSAVQVNEKDGDTFVPISRRLNEEALTDQNAAGQQLDLTKIVKQSGQFTKKAFNGKSKKRGVNFNTFESGKGIDLTFNGKTVTVYPQNANAMVIPAKHQGKTNDYVVYENLWNNVDLRYDYLGTSVKESIIIKSADAPSSFSFKVAGGKIVKDANGSLSIEGTGISLGGVGLTLNGDGPVETPVNLVANGNTVTTSLGSSVLKTLKASQFPAIIDPPYYIGSPSVSGGGNDFRNYDQDGHYSDASNNWMVVGGTRWSNNSWHYWHTIFHIPYDVVFGRQLDYAQFNTCMRMDSPYRGNTDAYNMALTWAPAFNYNFGGGGPVPGFTIATCGSTDATSLFNWMKGNVGNGGWIELWGEERGVVNLKQLDPYSTDVDFYVTDYNAQPTAPTLVTPSEGQTFTDPQPSFQMNAASDANGDALTYWFRVMGSKPSNCSLPTNTLVDSGELSALQWTVPDGVLKDGETYWFCGYSHDNAEGTNHSAGGNDWNWTTPVSFKVDYRLGKDKTQTYDDVGPFSVNYSNGNVTMSASSHTMNALGGSMGVNMEYNSPYQSRQGLSASYWSNNTSWSGAPTVTRIDGNVDFVWGTGSPSPYVTADNFSAAWNGYFVAPEAGTYTFGSNLDDWTRITVGGQVLQEIGCCGNDRYGNSITLSQGQVVPIKVEYIEATGYAAMQLLVKTPSNQNGQVVPKAWLRTDPVATRVSNGLTGRYYKLEDGEAMAIPTDGRQPFLSRTDTSVNFDYGYNAPIPNAPADRFAVRWSGFITAPQGTDYQFCVTSDDGERLSINNQSYTDAWTNRGPTQDCGAVQSWQAGETRPVTLDYFEAGGPGSVKLTVRYLGREEIVSPTWLTPSVKSLPDGWTLGIDPDGNVGYESLQMASSGNVTLYDSTGEKHTYTWTGSAYTPPTNEHGVLVRNSDNTFTLQDDDGRTYRFDSGGILTSVTTPQDDLRPAALNYIYGGTPSRIKQIVDGVTMVTDANGNQVVDSTKTRLMNIYYGGDTQCPATASGFDATPPNMICAAVSTDGNYTYFRYRAGFLARIETSGGVVTDLAYDSLGRIIQVREPLANDALSAGIRANDDSVTTQITYDAIGRASTVTLPSATAGAVRSQHTYSYQRLPDGTALGTTLMLDTKETMPQGYAQKIDYDTILREVNTYDKQGLKSTTLWDSIKDLSLASIDPTGLESTTVYNDNDLPTDSYGPAPSSWFTAASNPLSQKTPIVPSSNYTAQVPHTQTQYDQGYTGLALTYYARKTLTGAPGQHATGFNTTATAMSYADGVYPVKPTDGFSVRATGKIRLNEAGAQTFKVKSDGGARLYIDGGIVVDDWTDGAVRDHPTGIYTNATAGTLHDITVEYYHGGTTGAGSIQLFKTAPGGAETSDISALLSPNYGLTTGTVVFDSQQGNVTTKTDYGTRPELGLAQAVTEDVGGLNLTTSYTYEAQGSGSFLRQTSKTLPGGSKTQYQYYGAYDTRDNPCTAGTVEAYRQAGMAKGKLEPDPDGTGPLTGRTSETVYDESGRVVATRLNSDGWTCTFYDARGRVASTYITAADGSTIRQISNNYYVNNNPLIASSSDSSGTITTETDLSGRVTKYTDAKGNPTVSTFDDAGRLATRTSPLGAETFSYDDYDHLIDQKIDGTVVAHVSYDTYGRVSGVDYAAGSQKLSAVNRDSLGRTNGLSYTLANGSTISDSVTRNVSGDIMSGTENGVNKSYGYDNGGRLLSATLGSNTFAYDFSATPSTQCAQASANLNAGRSGNRTKYTLNGGTPTTYCYDQADRLISSSDATIGNPVYDAHGNTTQLGTAGNDVTAFTYDASDRNTGMVETKTTKTSTSTKNALGQTTKTDTTNVITKKIVYTRDVQGRLTSRVASGNTVSTVVTTPPIGNATTKTTTTTDTTVAANYGYTGAGDTPDFVTDSTNAVVEKYQQLPGNVLLTVRPKETDATKKTVYSLPNIHGDIFATTSATGTLVASYLTGPFGEQIAGQALPANTLAGGSFGYVGQYEKLTESAFTLGAVQMGARVYIPILGRFLSVDPQEGGTDNNYAYANDPVNEFDLDGNFINLRKLAKSITTVASWASIIPGPIGMVASGIAVAGNMAQGNWKGAALAATGLMGGGLIGKVAGNTKAMKAFMGVQAKMPVVGAKSVLFGMGGKTAIFKKIQVPTLGNRILPNITKSRLRVGWHSGDNHMLEFAIRKGDRHSVPLYRLPSNLNKAWRYKR